MASPAIARLGIALTVALTAALLLASCQPAPVPPTMAAGMHPAFVISAKPSGGPAAVDATPPTVVLSVWFQPPPSAGVAVVMAARVTPRGSHAKTLPSARAPPPGSHRIV